MTADRTDPAEPALVFVHSPLVGPLTWRPVADRFAAAGRSVAVPDLTGALHRPPYHPQIAHAVAAAAGRLRRSAVLVGHSGAGPLLPDLAYASPVPVQALLYVDAGLPHPGRSWFQTAPPELVDQLHRLASADGWLPPWHEWFPPETLAELLPDPQLRDRFTGELTRLPVGYFQEPTSDRGWSGATGYLLLSAAYRDQADRAAELGVPVRELSSHHLGMLTSPEPVAAALDQLLVELTSAR